jgi:hypothetical protein
MARFLTALEARVPDAPLAGPDIANDTSWLGPFIAAFGSELVFLTCHYYSEGPASSPDVTMERMLDSGGVLTNIINSVAERAAGSGLKVRMTETNSGGGKLGISDTLGAALWGIDVIFTLAHAGWLGINFHGGGSSHYSPIAQASSGAFEPRALYYAMLLFAYAGRGWLVPIHQQGTSSLRAFAVRGTDGERRVVLVNKDLAQNVRVRIYYSWKEGDDPAPECAFCREQNGSHLWRSFGRPRQQVGTKTSGINEAPVRLFKCRVTGKHCRRHSDSR